MPHITIQVPGSKEKLARIYQFLDKMGVPYHRAADEIHQQLSRKQKLLQRYRENPRFTGHGEELARLREEFRADFTLELITGYILDSDILDYLDRFSFSSELYRGVCPSCQ